VSVHAQVEATQAIAGQAVRAALEDHRFGLIVAHDVLDDWLKDGLVGFVCDTIAEGEVDRVVLSLPDSNVSELAGTREIFAVFVKRDCHDSIGGIEGLLHTIAMVNVDVDVEDALHRSQQFQDAEHNV
jgi:hypothetical protein